MPKKLSPSLDLLESHVKKAVKSVLKSWGAYQYWPVKTSALGATTVDCLACIPVKITRDMVGSTIGVFVAIETKRTKIDEPTSAQAEVFRQVREAGGGAALIHTVNDLEIEDGLVWAIDERNPTTWVLVGSKK